MPFHRAGSDEQLRADLRVGPAVPGQLGDLLLLRSQVSPGDLTSLAHLLPGGQQLAPGPPGERLGAHHGQHAVGGSQLGAGVSAAVLAAQPFAIDQVGTGELRAQPGAAEPVDRLTVQVLGGLAVAQQRA